MFEICHNCKPNTDDLPDGLPSTVQYLLCENKRSEDGTSSVVLRSSGNTEQDAKSWLRTYSCESRSTWRIQCAHPESGRKNVFKCEYRCQHNTRHKRSGSAKRKPSLILKNTECPAKLTITVKRVPKRSRSLDKHLPDYPMVIQLKNEHNHSPDCVAALRHRDVSTEVRAKFEVMYREQRHSPGTALTTHLHDLHQEYGDDIYAALNDRSICPDRGWCYSLYYKVFNKEYRERGPDSRLECLEEVLADYDKIIGEECSRLRVLDSQEFACAIITPLMKRNHVLNFHAGDICYVDSTGKCDRDKTAIKIFLLLTDSEAGGIPLGLLAVSSDSDRVLYEAWMLYRTMLHDNYHYGKGLAGPQAFITEDCEALRNTISVVFPEATLLLSIPHIIQSAWKHLCSQTNGIPPAKRPSLLSAATRLVHCISEEELDAVFYDNIEANSELTHQYARFQEYLRTIYSKRNLWAPYLFRQGLMMRGHAAIIVSETAMRVMRDVILHRLRNYNLPQLAHFVFTRVDEYYGRRLQDVVNDKEALAARRRFVLSRTPVLPEHITQLSQFHFQVGEGNKTMFDVDVGVGTCSCSVGTTSGAPCKHQYAIAVHFGTHTLLPPTSYSNPGCPTSAKICLYQIATGRRVDLPDEWFKHQQPDEMPLNHPHHSSELQKVDVIDGPSLPPPSPVQSEPVHHVLEEASDEENREQTQETLHKFTSVFSKLKDKYLKDPSLYGPALERFCSTLESMPSDSSIVPALTNFGKYGAQNENTLEIPMSGWFN